MSLLGGGAKKNQDELGTFTIDIAIMYIVAFVLDMAGIILAAITLTIILAPIAIILQWILSLLGSLIFTLWIVFVRSQSSDEETSNELPEPETLKETAPSQASFIDDSVPKKLEQAAEAQLPVKPPKKSPAKKPKLMKKSNPSSLLMKKWLKRVGLSWFIESIPIVGKISFTWVLAVYFEQKNG